MNEHGWEITKTEDGGSFTLWVGHPGIPGSFSVPDLSRKQAEQLGDALIALEKKTTFRALERVREAIGI